MRDSLAELGHVLSRILPSRRNHLRFDAKEEDPADHSKKSKLILQREGPYQPTQWVLREGQASGEGTISRFREAHRRAPRPICVPRGGIAIIELTRLD